MHQFYLIVTILLYACANIALWRAIRHASSPAWLWRIPACVALGLHGFLLYQWIDHGHIQDVGWTNIVSMTIWLAGLLIVLTSWARSVQNLTLLIFPLAIVSLIMRHYYSVHDNLDTGANIHLLIHILLSIVAGSVWWIALVLAILLAIQNSLLRRQINLYWLSFLPTLESMETLLFQCIALGFILLTAVLASASWIAQQTAWSYVLPKAVFSGLAWIVYGILLWGRHYYGWHGRQAIRGTLLGFALLILAYVGSQVLL